jgi:XTP/dITP diphosphohydrolase
MKTPGELFEELVQIFKKLRDPNGGCPWDLKQTHSSLKPYLIEESYETIDAIESAPEKLPEELGDVLLQVMLHSQIGADDKRFSISDVITSLSEKMIKRHPHVFGTLEVKDSEGVLKNWEKIKLLEGNKSVLGGVPVSLPAMIKATRIQEKARGVGFDWDHEAQVWEKVQEEMQEFRQEVAAGNSEKAEAEFGDLLFSLINYARFRNINPEDALEKTNRKFIRRFTYLEEESKKDGKELSRMTLEEMDRYWEDSKQTE